MSKAKWTEVLVNFWSSTDNYKRALQVFLHVNDSGHHPWWNVQAGFLARLLLGHLQLISREEPHSLSMQYV